MLLLLLVLVRKIGLRFPGRGGGLDADTGGDEVSIHGRVKCFGQIGEYADFFFKMDFTMRRLLFCIC